MLRFSAVWASILSLVLCFCSPTEAGILKSGDILVANGVGRNILKVDPLTGQHVEIASGGFLMRPLGIAVGPDGRIFVVDEDYSDGALIEIDPQTGSQSVLTHNLNRQPSGIAIDSQYNLYVSEQLGVSQTVRIDPTTGNVTGAYGGPGLFNRPMHPAVRGSTLIVPNRSFPGAGTGFVVRIDLLTGQESIIAQLSEPHGSAIDPLGDYLIADSHTLYRIDKDSLQLTTLANGFGSLTGLAIEPGGSIIAADRGTTKRIWRVDPSTGNRVAISQGGMLAEPFQVAIYSVAAPEPSTSMLTVVGLLIVGTFQGRFRRRCLTHIEK